LKKTYKITPEALDRFPRLGWIDRPTPVTPLEKLAKTMGISWLGVKRDDQCPVLHGGTKVRKLDFLLAAPPYHDAPDWSSVGAIGSGHLVACTAAARQLKRAFHAYTFWEPLTDGILDNLAFIASQAEALHFYRSRITTALCKPGLFLSKKMMGTAVIPFGATCPGGILGTVRAGLELSQQVEAGELPEPERIYVALGSCGTVVGLAIGLALGGLSSRIHAVTTVERILSPRSRLDKLLRQSQQLLATNGLIDAEKIEPAPIVLDRSQLGKGYGYATKPAIRAVEVFHENALELETVYTGKAAAAMLRDLPLSKGGPVLFWNTRRGALPEPAPDWQAHLPKVLAQRIASAKQHPASASRRRVLKWMGGAAAAAVVAWVAFRTTGYPEMPGWKGTVLSAREAAILIAAAEVILPPSTDTQAHRQTAENVDHYLKALPEAMVSQIHLMLNVVEHLTPAALHLSRFTRLEAEGKRDYLRFFREKEGALRLVYRGLRDLCLLGFYQRERAWTAIGYPGPLVSGHRSRQEKYARLVAPPGATPKSAVSS